MTAPALAPDAVTLEDIAPPCCVSTEDGECPHSATWVGITKCCGQVYLLCDEHHDAILEAIRLQEIWCADCKARHLGNPFSTMERL
jgi:hypothetical protein